MTGLTNQEFLEHFKEINNIKTVEDIAAYIKRIDALKVALESIDRFREQSVKYAQLEAYALIRAVELGGAKKIQARHRKTAEWLASLSEEERTRYISMCADGLTIDNIYKREVGAKQFVDEVKDAADREKDKMLVDLSIHGVADLSKSFESIREKCGKQNASLANDVIDGIRNRLRHAGAVSIGKNTSVYVMPKYENQEAIKRAIVLRWKGVQEDINRIREIMGYTNAKFDLNDFDYESLSERDKQMVMSFLITLVEDGRSHLKEPESFYESALTEIAAKIYDYKQGKAEQKRQREVMEAIEAKLFAAP